MTAVGAMLRHASDAATFRSILFGRSAGVSQRWLGVGTAGEFNVRVGDEEWPVSEARPQTDKRKRRPATVLDSIRPHRGGRQLPARRPVPANDSASSKPRPCSACQSLSKRTRPAAACPMHPAAVSGGCCSQPESRVCAAASWSSRSSDRGRHSGGRRRASGSGPASAPATRQRGLAGARTSCGGRGIGGLARGRSSAARRRAARTAPAPRAAGSCRPALHALVHKPRPIFQSLPSVAASCSET